MDFVQLNWAAWTLFCLQCFGVLIIPFMIGREKSPYSGIDFLFAVIALILLSSALKII